jgi:predicted AAA+ superfamily ATPase
MVLSLSACDNQLPGLYKVLAPVHDAEYTRSGRVARCLQHTRKEVMENIRRLVDKSDARICWIKGPAGSGKSAISQTVAEWYAAKNRLAARCVLCSVPHKI